jgi:hypothetical protein
LRGKVQDIVAVMDLLTHAGWVVPAEARADGFSWDVNPDVHERFAKAAETQKAERDSARDLIRRRVADL